MNPPRDALAGYLRGAAPGASVEPLAGDASARRFFRLHLVGGATRVVMDYGAPFSEETDDIRATRLFESAALPVPRIHDSAPEPGCLILDDLGDVTLERALASASPGERRRLYESAVDLALAIAVRGTAALERDSARWPTLDARRFRFEMDFFVEHYARGLAGRSFLPAKLVTLLHELADRTAESPHRVLCHRDFHSRNLLVLDGGALAAVDIQDARRGPDTYDLASLLRDAYVDLDEAEVDEMIDRYRDGLPRPQAPEKLRARFDLVGAQRMIKALGTFGFQVGRLGRRRYLDAVFRTLERLRRLLPSTSGTADLAAAFDDAGLFSEPSVQ